MLLGNRVVHQLAVQRNGGPPLRLGPSKGGYDAGRLLDLINRRREDAVHGADLRRVDAHLAAEAEPTRSVCLCEEAGSVVDGSVYGVNRLDTRGAGSQGQRGPRQQQFVAIWSQGNVHVARVVVSTERDPTDPR